MKVTYRDVHPPAFLAGLELPDSVGPADAVQLLESALQIDGALP